MKFEFNTEGQPMRFRIFLTIVLGLFLLAPALAQTYHHPSGDFSFTPPAGWVKSKEEANRVAFDAPGERATLQVSVHTTLLHKSAFDDPTWVERIRNSFTGIGLQAKSTTKTRLGGQPAFRINMDGKNTPMGHAKGFNVVSATSKGKRLAFLGITKMPAHPGDSQALEKALASVVRK